MSQTVENISSVVVEREDGKSVVLRRSVEHPGQPVAASPLKGFSVKRTKVNPGSIRFFGDAAKMSSKLRHS